MKNSKILEERIRRVRVLFKELGYKVVSGERTEDSYTAAFEGTSETQGGFFIDNESRFLEVGYTFSFSSSMGDFLRQRLEEMLKICYEFGCYTNIQKTEQDISFSIFTKIYFSGLNYYSLRDSLKDYHRCVELTTELLEFKPDGRDEDDRMS
jgi:hypothetical protein